MAAQPAALKAEQGEEVIRKALEEAEGAGQWGDLSLQALLTNGQAVPEGGWTLDSLDRMFKHHHLPCWVLRSIADKGGPRVVVWSNDAARKKMGEPRSAEEVLDWWKTLPAFIAAPVAEVLKTLYTLIAVNRQKIVISMNLSKTIHQNWHGLPRELFARLREESMDVILDGQLETCYFSLIEREIGVQQLRGTAMTTYTPVHSYLFSQTGELLYANSPACLKIKAQGVADVRDFKLEHLLIRNGQHQPALAQEAIDKLCKGMAGHHAVTLSTLVNGKLRHTLYEMWLGRDPINSLEPCIVLSAFNVTEQKDVELELRSLKTTLLRHNTDLQQQMNEAVLKQAKLEAERLTLQARLKDALEIHMTPCTNLDTSSPVDRTVALLDGLLEGQIPSAENIVKLRNSLLQGTDLRRTSNLESQLRGQLNLSEDASESLVTLLQDNNRASNHLTQLSSPRGTPTHAGRRRFVRSSTSLHHSHRDFDMHGPALSISSEAERLLQDARSNWGFDMSALDRATNGHCLSCFGFWLLQQTGILGRFAVPEVSMSITLRHIEKGYHPNAYHNRIHAASVLQMSHMLVHCQDGLADTKITDDLLEFSLYLAAICHDYDHPGVTNDFLIKSHAPLAMRYNDRSVLESHHAAASFQILSDHLSTEQYKMEEDLHNTMRASIIELILATDMKQHFALVSRLQGIFQSGAYTANQMNLAKNVEPSLSNKSTMSAESRLLAVQMALKCADVGHLALPAELHATWVKRLQEEFYAQGDKEREAGMVVSALMERNKASDISSSQVGFFEVVALPLMRSMAAVVPGAAVMAEATHQNYLMWRKAALDKAA